MCKYYNCDSNVLDLLCHLAITSQKKKVNLNERTVYYADFDNNEMEM